MRAGSNFKHLDKIGMVVCVNNLTTQEAEIRGPWGPLCTR